MTKRRAVISCADKSGLADFARELLELGWEIVSTGGTYKHLSKNGLEVREVSEITGFPEMLDGRVKTLHPKIHGGILARRGSHSDIQELASNNVGLVDMVVCNLYPFVATANRPTATIEEITEEIDIGGPTLLRAAAKNWNWVIVVCKPERYQEIIRQLRLTGDVDKVLRRNLAIEVFRHTATYDSAIASYLGSQFQDWPLDFPDELTFGYKKALSLRYGENPHQRAGFYLPVMSDAATMVKAQIQGKELSYNNINDSEGAVRTVWDLPHPACVIVKHAAPCGAATGNTAQDAFDKAFQGDPVSAFGGIVAFNCQVDRDTALSLKKIYIEVLIAPSYTPEALEVLKVKKDLRILVLSPRATPQDVVSSRYTLKSALGGLLVGERDLGLPRDEDWQVVTKRAPTDQEIRDLRFAMTVCKHVRSNAIVLAKDGATVGIGGGQPNRVDCVRIAVERAKERSQGACMASDAFFPFPDSVIEAAKAGVSAIVHPGGSIRDQESCAAADEHNIAMVISGRRHFLH